MQQTIRSEQAVIVAFEAVHLAAEFAERERHPWHGRTACNNCDLADGHYDWCKTGRLLKIEAELAPLVLAT